ncbi:MAG TPA: archease [Thermoplasmata archaeon]|nr:archease [Thermoplasmata archaeon]
MGEREPSGRPLKVPWGVLRATNAHRVSSSRARRWGSFPTTADVGIWATGANPAALFEALGLGLFALMTDLRKVRRTEERAVSASGADPAELVVAFLTELIVLQQTDGFLARDIRARPIGNPPTALVASVSGEPFDPKRHSARIEVKAVTLHGLVFDAARGRARVIVDI